MKQQILSATPKEFGALGGVGLGQTLASPNWAKIPTYYWDIATLQLPMTPEQIQATLTGAVNLFSTTIAQPNRQTNTSSGSSVNDLFLAMGVGIVAIGEGMSFSLPGAAIGSVQLAADSDLPVPGCQAPGVDGNPLTPATYWWGGPTWYIIEKFFRSFKLQVIANNRFLLVDESAEDIGMSPLPPEFIGASSSRVPASPFIRKTNDHILSSDGFGENKTQFLPQSIAVDEAGSTCVPPPDAGATYGHPCIAGLANRVYPFVRPILFAPGMQWDMQLVPQAAQCDVDTMVSLATINCQTASSLQADVVDGGIASNNTCVIPGGCISLGVVIKGVSLWPSACIDFLSNFYADLPQFVQGMYGTNPFIQGLMQKYQGHPEYGPKVARLSGLLAGKPIA